MPDPTLTVPTRQARQVYQPATATPATQRQAAPTIDQAALASVGRQYQEVVERLGQSLEQGKNEFRNILIEAKARKQPAPFKSRALRQAFAGAAGLIERTLQLEKNGLSSDILNNGPFIVNTERALAGSSAALNKMEELNALLDGQPGTDGCAHKQQIDEKLNELGRSIEQFIRCVDVGGLDDKGVERFGVFFEMANAVREMADEMKGGTELQPATGTTEAMDRPLDSLDLDKDPFWSDPDTVWAASPQSMTPQEREEVAEIARGFKAPLAQLQRAVEESVKSTTDQEVQRLKQTVDADVDKLDRYIGDLEGGRTPGERLETGATAPTAAAKSKEIQSLEQELSGLEGEFNKEVSRQPGKTGIFSRFRSRIAGLFRRTIAGLFRNKTHYCSNLSPGKPSEAQAGKNPLFYHERQKARLCLKHSLNAFLGGEVFTDETLAASVRNNKLRQFRQEMEERPRQVANEWGDVVAGLTPEQVTRDPDAAAEQVTDAYFKAFTQGTSLVNYVRGGNEVNVGLAALEDKASELGLPDTELADFRTGEQEAMIDYLQKTEDRVDRMIVGNMRHFMAFRKSAEGNWFRIDSTSSSQKRQKPSDYVREHPVDRLRHEQYQFLTFAGSEFVPNIKLHPRPPLGTDLA